jgi:hypothetical protein
MDLRLGDSGVAYRVAAAKQDTLGLLTAVLVETTRGQSHDAESFPKRPALRPNNVHSKKSPPAPAPAATRNAEWEQNRGGSFDVT